MSESARLTDWERSILFRELPVEDGGERIERAVERILAERMERSQNDRP